MPCCVYKMSKVRKSQQHIILSGQPYYNFINALRSSSTKQIYVFSLKRYLKFQKCNDVEQLFSNDPRLIESQLINYIMYMRQQEKLSYQSVHTYVKALISFYEMNDIVLNKRKIGGFVFFCNTRTPAFSPFVPTMFASEIVIISNRCNSFLIITITSMTLGMR
jgi:hypothetical protein